MPATCAVRGVAVARALLDLVTWQLLHVRAHAATLLTTTAASEWCGAVSDAAIIVAADAERRQGSPPKESIVIDNKENGPRNHMSGARGGAGSVGVTPAAPAWHLPQPRKSGATEFFRVFVKALHSLAVLVFAAAAFYLMYCGLTGHRDGWMVAALVAVAVETVAYLGFGVKCPLTMLARWLGDDGGHDYLFEWLLGRERIWLVSRSLALLAATGVALILIGSFTPLLPS